MAPTIGIFPASGKLGTSIVNHLVKQVSATDLVLINRKPHNLAALSRAGATVRKADYDDPRSMDGVFDGIEVLMLVSYASYEVDRRANAHKCAIESAVRSGVSHIFYSSLAFAGGMSNSSSAQVMQAHLRTERYLHENARHFTYTCVREGLYSESFPLYMAGFDLENPVHDIQIPHPGDGPGIAWVKTDELGEATANLITSYTKEPHQFPYVNRPVLFSGAQELSLNETAVILGRIVKQPIRISEKPLWRCYAMEALRHGLKSGYQGATLTLYGSTFDAIKKGEAAVVSPVLGQFLGREPESFEATVRALKEREKRTKRP